MYAIFRLMTDIELTHCENSVSHSLDLTKEGHDTDIHDSLSGIQESLRELQEQIQGMRKDLTKE